MLYRNQMVPQGALEFLPEPIAESQRFESVNTVVVYDLDDDGDSDLVFNGWGYRGRAGIWRNTAVEGGAPGRILRVWPTRAGRPVYGAIITARFEMSMRIGISGHAAQNISDGPVRLSLGEWSGPVSLEVRWPNGLTTTHEAPADARRLVIEAP